MRYSGRNYWRRPRVQGLRSRIEKPLAVTKSIYLDHASRIWQTGSIRVGPAGVADPLKVKLALKLRAETTVAGLDRRKVSALAFFRESG
jgi:hypothetical protein